MAKGMGHIAAASVPHELGRGEEGTVAHTNYADVLPFSVFVQKPLHPPTVGPTPRR